MTNCKAQNCLLITGTENISAPSGDEDQPITHTCKITYANDPGVSSFNYSRRPSGGVESGGDRLWNEDF
jgi:hypothetical protein